MTFNFLSYFLVFMYRVATRIPPMLVQYDAAANSSVCLLKKLIVGDCINLQSGFLLWQGLEGRLTDGLQEIELQEIENDQI